MTTTPQAFQAQWPLAVQALGVHAQMHRLPAPLMVDFRAPHIYVSLPSDSYDRWLSTVVVDAERNEERHPAGVPAMRTEWDVRLPDTGFTFTLATFRPIPAQRPAAVPA